MKLLKITEKRVGKDYGYALIVHVPHLFTEEFRKGASLRMADLNNGIILLLQGTYLGVE